MTTADEIRRYGEILISCGVLNINKDVSSVTYTGSSMGGKGVWNLIDIKNITQERE